MIGERQCLHCGSIFYPLKFWQKYCCSEHRIAAYYLRKAAKDKLDVLDIRDGPTELQEADWASRSEIKEADVKESHDAQVLKQAQDLLTRMTPSVFDKYDPTKENKDGKDIGKGENTSNEQKRDEV